MEAVGEGGGSAGEGALCRSPRVVPLSYLPWEGKDEGKDESDEEGNREVK